jgi:protein-tyrosine-phosphatase
MDGSRQVNSLVTTAGRFLALIMPALIVFGLGQLTVAASAADAVAPDGKTIVFVCLHGSVKSQMAAAHFNRIARERGLPYTAISRGIEVDSSIPTRIRDNLNLDGLAPLDDVPQPLMPGEADGAVKVIAFDAVPDEKRGVAEVNYWSDVPPATKDYTAARDVIVHHIDDLIPALAEQPRPQETLRGVITGIDERSDRITLRLASDASADFRDQDGLLFNAVRDGDQVEITVENIEGAKTIVGLKKE